MIIYLILVTFGLFFTGSYFYGEGESTKDKILGGFMLTMGFFCMFTTMIFVRVLA